jgi:hypothetical protein
VSWNYDLCGPMVRLLGGSCHGLTTCVPVWQEDELLDMQMFPTTHDFKRKMDSKKPPPEPSDAGGKKKGRIRRIKQDDSDDEDFFNSTPHAPHHEDEGDHLLFSTPHPPS